MLLFIIISRRSDFAFPAMPPACAQRLHAQARAQHAPGKAARKRRALALAALRDCSNATAPRFFARTRQAVLLGLRARKDPVFFAIRLRSDVAPRAPLSLSSCVLLFCAARGARARPRPSLRDALSFSNKQGARRRLLRRYSAASAASPPPGSVVAHVAGRSIFPPSRRSVQTKIWHAKNIHL